MSLRAVSVVAVFALACAGESMKVKKGEPQTAREKMLAEEKAKQPESKQAPQGSKNWGGWRYQGERKDCFFVVGRKCFKSKNAACQAARCKAPLKCTPEGAGPAKVKCEKEDAEG